MKKLKSLPTRHVEIDMSGDGYSDPGDETPALIYARYDIPAAVATTLYDAVIAPDFAAMSEEERTAHDESYAEAIDGAVAAMVVGTNLEGHTGKWDADALARLREGEEEERALYQFLLLGTLKRYYQVLDTFVAGRRQEGELSKKNGSGKGGETDTNDSETPSTPT